MGTAKILSIISSIIIVAQAVCSTFVPISILKLFFLFEFLMSDTLIFFGSICVLLNKSSAFSTKSGSQFKQGAFAMSLHMVGVGLRLYQTPTQLFDTYILPNIGWAWALIVLAIVPQIYLSHNIFLGQCNKLGGIDYDKEQQPWLRLFAKILAPIAS